MLTQRFPKFFQTLGIGVFALLTLYGAASIFQNAEGVLGAPAAAVQNAPMLQTGVISATTPTFINYQGILRNPEGAPISGVQKMTFRIYADVTDPLPEAIWLEQHDQVTVRNGHFSVLLGDLSPISPTLFLSPDRFIGITVDPYDEMVPRQRFASVPYALDTAYAHDADTVDGQHASAFAAAGHRHNALSAGDGDPGQAVYVADNGNVGVGTQTPETALQVTGNRIRLVNGNRVIDLRADGGVVDLEAPNTNLHISSNGGNRSVLLNPNNGGYVGVGTETPMAKLDVHGRLAVRGKPLVYIARFKDQPNNADINTNVSAFDYFCVNGGWSALYDIEENDGNINMVWTYVKEGRWWARVVFASDGDSEQPDFDIVCFHQEIAQFSGDQYLNDPD